MSKSDLLPIEKTVRKQLQHHFSYPEKVLLVMGVSGGADSMCLLHILHALGVELQIVHINYQKRGEASQKDAALVRKVADKLGISVTVIAVNPEEAKGQNFQQWAREQRYSAFEREMKQLRTDGIALGHHKDDQIETILQKIFRGGGLASWSAMQVWNGRLFRPLLAVNRNEIEAYCRLKSISFRDDESNFTSDFARNFLRNKWLPELEQHFPGWQKNVLRVAEQADVFASSLQFIGQHLKDDRDRINRQEFLALDEALQKSMLIHYAKNVDADATLSRQALKECAKLEALQTGKALQLTKNIALMRDRSYFKLVVDTGESTSFLTLRKEDLQKSEIAFNGFQFGLKRFESPAFGQQLYLDEQALAWPLRLRKWRAGDRFQPLGMQGHQSVAEHLTNRKVSATEKPGALVLESFEETICAVIFTAIKNRRPPGTISEKMRCRSSTRQCVTIKRSV